MNKLLIESLKGISGSGDVIGQLIKLRGNNPTTLEPGDFSGNNKVMAAPIGFDIWYLNSHDNFMTHYYAEEIGDTYDFTTYISENLKFLENLQGLMPLKTLRYLDELVQVSHYNYGYELTTEWKNNGMYWINTLAFELWLTDVGYQYASDGPKNFKPNDYAGYISFPVGQLGVMEIISLIRESDISGYLYDGEMIKAKIEAESDERPVVQNPAALFPQLTDKPIDKCYGKHLIEKGYVVPTSVERDMELMAQELLVYSEDVRPKKWMRYWIHKESKWPIPGEFVGILCKPLITPPHVWWFQESYPFLYSGNWIETANLTSGEITEVILEEDRTDEGIGNIYKIKIEGCEVYLEASDFFVYKVGDRVAVLKMDSTEIKQTKSFTWQDQRGIVFDSSDKDTIIENYIIIPATFYGE